MYRLNTGLDMGGPAAPERSSGFTGEKVVSTPSIQSATGAVVIRFNATRTEADVDGIFLAYKESATLGPAAARYKTDFHSTGNKTAVDVLAGDVGVPVELDLDPSVYSMSNDGQTVHISDRARINITTSRIAVAIDGTVTNSMSGQASVSTEACFGAVSFGTGKLVNVTYANWMDLSCVVQISDIHVVDKETNVEIPNVMFTMDEEFDTVCAEAEKVIQTIYDASMQTRSVVVYEAAPPLSKSVMRVPFGINGSTYDFACNVVDRPPSLHRDAFESLARACLLKELDMDANATDAVVEQCKTPGIAATRWAPKIANALSSAICFLCPYRVDGVTKLMPDGISLVQAESWKAEAARDTGTCDDCDGDTAGLTSQMYDAIEVSRSPDLAARYPTTAAFANAMAHHCIGVCVLSANAGHAGAAGEDGQSAIAGHAISMAIPKPTVLTSMITGLSATLQEKEQDVIEASISEMAPMWARGLYSDEDIKRMPVEEREVLQAYERIMNLPKRLPDNSGFVTLAMEGTSPVSPSTLHPIDDLDRLRRKKFAKMDKQVEAMIGPSVSRTVTQLDVAEEGDEHVFYNSFVEFLMPLHNNPMFTNEDVRKRGFATAQFVFTQATDPRVAGITPRQAASGGFGMLPLWKLNVEQAGCVDTAIREVRANTMPYRNNPAGQPLTERQTEIFNRNVKALKSLNASHRITSVGSKEAHAVQHIFSLSGMFGNAFSIDEFVSRLKSMPAVDVMVDVIDTPNLLKAYDGHDIGNVIVLNIRAVL
jgi:hypothetical protein